MEDTTIQLQQQLDHIAQNINNGIVITKDNAEEYYDLEIGDNVGGLDYLSDALDFTYKVDFEKRYLAAEILVAFGGPNIYINTAEKRVEGYWGRDKLVANYHTDTLGIDDACEELFNMID